MEGLVPEEGDRLLRGRRDGLRGEDKDRGRVRDRGAPEDRGPTASHPSPRPAPSSSLPRIPSTPAQRRGPPRRRPRASGPSPRLGGHPPPRLVTRRPCASPPLAASPHAGAP